MESIPHSMESIPHSMESMRSCLCPTCSDQRWSELEFLLPQPFWLETNSAMAPLSITQCWSALTSKLSAESLKAEQNWVMLNRTDQNWVLHEYYCCYYNSKKYVHKEGLNLGLQQYFTLLHEFCWIPLDSCGMSEFHWESAGMVGMCHSCGFPWIPSGISVEFQGNSMEIPLKF